MTLNYAGSEAMLEDPYTFPGVGDVAGLPPVYVLNSEVDLLRASGEAFATALKAAAVEVRVEHEPGTGHGHLNVPRLPEAARSLDRIAGWLSSH